MHMFERCMCCEMGRHITCGGYREMVGRREVEEYAQVKFLFSKAEVSSVFAPYNIPSLRLLIVILERRCDSLS